MLPEVSRQSMMSIPSVTISGSFWPAWGRASAMTQSPIPIHRNTIKMCRSWTDREGGIPPKGARLEKRIRPEPFLCTYP